MRDYNAAFDYFNQALSILQKFPFPQGEALVEERRGIIYGALGHYQKALEHFNKALGIIETLPSLDLEAQASIKMNQGTIYVELSDYDNALRSYQESLIIAQKISNLEMQGNVLHNLGAVHQFKGELNEAVESYQQSLVIAQKIGDQRVERSALGSLGLVNWQLGNYNEAVKLYKQSLALAERLQDPQEKALALTNLGRNLLASGEIVEAEKQLKIAIQIWESIREELNDSDHISIFDKQLLPYHLLQEALVKQGTQDKLEAALEIAERGRNRAFISLLSRRLELNSDALDSSGLAETPTIEKIRQIAQTQNLTLVQYSIIPVDNFLHPSKVLGKPAKLYIWVVQPTGKVAFRSVDLQAKTFP